MEFDRGVAAPVHRLQQGLAVAALVVAGPVTAWGLPQPVAGPFFLACLGAAAPLLFLRAPRGFVPACLTAGSLLLVLGVLGVMAGTFLYWPSALLLLSAAFADPRRRPFAARAVGGVGAVVTAAALVGCAAYTWHFYGADVWAEPHTYRAETDPGSFRPGALDAQDRLKRLGATEVWGAGSDEDYHLEVRFPDQLSESERARLKSEIATLPGVISVDLCPVSECG
ncbi:hypothetical protein [Streptomyces sp. NPDC058084]|uniref:hypothetical protein n=1 Tax=Streptomyces sp. NPDC058084 TaxID=3346333 RepID=UPI0036EF62AC